MLRGTAALAVLAAGAIWTGAAGSSGVASCTHVGTTATVTLAGDGSTMLGIGPDAQLLVDGRPCGSAAAGTGAIRVLGGAGRQSISVDPSAAVFGGTTLTVRLGADDDAVDATAHSGRGIRLAGGGGADELVAGRGPDRIRGGPGNDSCEGGPGRDRLFSCMPRFEARSAAIEGEDRRLMTGSSWRRGCPVALGELRLVELRHWGFRRDVHQGELVVHENAVGDVTRAMRAIFTRRFPIRRMRLVDHYGADDRRSMRADNTSAFNCRFIAGRPGVWSQHAYGRAIDVNPIENPYVGAGGFVSPSAGRRFADRSRDAKGMIHRGDRVVRAFRSVGWEWGGEWRSPRDYQHFSANGR